MRPMIVALVVMLGMGPRSTYAQAVERPVPFDSAGQVMTMSVPLATRLHLGPPTWPVTGDYVEVRLFDRGEGRYVLVVERANRAVERYELSTEARAALQRQITSAMLTSGRLTTGEREDILSQPARGAFIRNQTFGALLIYGPAASALANGGGAATAMYLASVGAAFFTSAQISRNRTVTNAQNHMATDGIWRGAMIADGLLYLGGGETSGDAYAAATLGGAIAGTLIGFNVGRPMTDGEAAGATFGSTTLGLATAGVIGLAGGYQHDEARGEVGGILAGVLAGFPVGLRYVRRAAYGVTSGDVSVMSTMRNIGILGAAAAITDTDPSATTASGVLTAGLVLGTILGDRLFVRRYDFTESEGNLAGLGALVGGLAAIAIPLAAEAEGARLYTGLGALGGLAGLAITTSIIRPAPSHSERRTEHGGASSRSAAGRSRGALLQFHPENAAMLFANHRTLTPIPILSVRY